jgi:hypothetical protein
MFCIILGAGTVRTGAASLLHNTGKNSPTIPYVKRCALKKKLEAEPPEPHQNFNPKSEPHKNDAAAERLVPF